MIRELEVCIKQIHQARQYDGLSPDIERLFQTLRTLLCQSGEYCSECAEIHKKQRDDMKRVITAEELDALCGR
jgi:hypothetical protein